MEMLKETLSSNPGQTILCPERSQERISTSSFFSESLWTGESKQKNRQLVQCNPHCEWKKNQHDFLRVTGMKTDTLREVFLHSKCCIIPHCLPSITPSPQPLCLSLAFIPVPFNKLTSVL